MKYPKWYLRFVANRSGFLAIWTILSPFCIAMIVLIAIKKACQSFWRELVSNFRDFFQVWRESLESKTKDESDPEFWNAL